MEGADTIELDDAALAAASVRYYDTFGVEFSAQTDDHPTSSDLWGIISQMPRDGLMLDLGCGSGRAVRALRQMGVYRYIGIDLSTTMLDVARERFPSLDFRHGDIRKLVEVLQQPADAFICIAMLMQIPKSDVLAAFQSIRSVLKEGGVGYIATPQGSERHILDHRRPNSGFPPGHVLLLQQWSLSELKQIAADASFEVIQPTYAPPGELMCVMSIRAI